MCQIIRAQLSGGKLETEWTLLIRLAAAIHVDGVRTSDRACKPIDIICQLFQRIGGGGINIHAA